MDSMTTAKQIWDVLVKRYDTTNEATTFALFEELVHEDRLKDDKTLIDQFSALVARLSKVNTDDVKLSDTLKAMILMSKVPESYRSVMTTLVQTNKLKVLTTDKIREALETELSFRRATFQGPDAGASKVSQTKPKPKKPCSHCKGTNHNESHCWQKYPEKKPKNMKGKGKKEKGKEKDTGQTHDHAHITAPFINLPVQTTLSSSNDISASFYSAALAANQDGMTIWLMDSGASSHITAYKTDFTNYTEYEQPKTFCTAQDGEASVVQALGEGDIMGTMLVNGKKIGITLHNVCYIPKAGTRLFSMGTIKRSGCILIQGNGCMSIIIQSLKAR